MHEDRMKEKAGVHAETARFCFLSRVQMVLNRQNQQFGVIAPQL